MYAVLTVCLFDDVFLNVDDVTSLVAETEAAVHHITRSDIHLSVHQRSMITRFTLDYVL